MTKKEQKEQTKTILDAYLAYKVADLHAKLLEFEIPQEDVEYIMQGGKSVKMVPHDELEEWLDKAMDRMAERIPLEKAVNIRQSSACCLKGKRETLARKIYKENGTIDKRFEAFSKERYIIGGNAWKDGDDYYVTYWYAKPEDGYTCGCLKCVPKQPMNKLWCECCAGHIKHHFETALGVRAESACVTSVLTTCGEEACLFRLHIVES